jgi:hypothetical protein
MSTPDDNAAGRKGGRGGGALSTLKERKGGEIKWGKGVAFSFSCESLLKCTKR